MYGVEQIVMSTKMGDQRAMSLLLRNVFDARMALLAQPWQTIGQY